VCAAGWPFMMNENWTKPREDEILGSKKIVICGLRVGAFVMCI